jgi:hypothetical protein
MHNRKPERLSVRRYILTLRHTQLASAWSACLEPVPSLDCFCKPEFRDPGFDSNAWAAKVAHHLQAS